MKIGIASDHRGYELKKKIMKDLKNIDFEDFGCFSKESCDYPEYAFKLGKAVSSKKVDLGIAICGSGIGISIACNKVKGVRCARVTSIKDVIYTRKDNDANIIAFSSSINYERVLRMIEEFLNTPFSKEDRHIRRNKMIDEYK